jgi:hypothetical protein
MGRHREWEILGVDPRAIVDDTHEPHASLLERDGDTRRTGIEGVLEKFFDDARGPLDHLAGGDPVDDRHREGVDATHGLSAGASWRSRHRPLTTTGTP